MTVPRLLLGASLGVCLSAPWWGPLALREVPFFEVQRVEVSGVALLAPHEVLAASGIDASDNVWDDPDAWVASLTSHPVVRGASVERSFPNTLRVRVEERRPVALLASRTLRPVTAEGEILPVDPARAGVDLPLLHLPGSDSADTRIEDPQALVVLAEIGRLSVFDPVLVGRISEIRRAPSGDLLLRLGHPAAEVLLPVGADPARLAQLRAVLDDVERRADRAVAGQPAPAPVRVDGRFAEQVVVRFPSPS